MYDLKDVTSSITEPITLTEIKEYLRVSHSNDDDLLEELITAGRLKFEDVTWKSVVPHDFILTFDNEETEFPLPSPPIDDVTSVSWWDGEEWTELDNSDDYYVLGEYDKTIQVLYYYDNRLKVEYSTLGDDRKEYLNLIKEWIHSVYFNASADEEDRVVKRMAMLRKWRAK